MLRATVVAIALLAPASALAQTTTCRNTMYGMPEFGVTCETDAPKPAIRPEDVEPRRCSGGEWVIHGAAMCSARKTAADRLASRKSVTDKISAGDCDGAVKGALELGDLAYAREVRDFCSR